MKPKRPRTRHQPKRPPRFAAIVWLNVRLYERIVSAARAEGTSVSRLLSEILQDGFDMVE